MPKKPSIKSGDRFNTNQGYVVEVIEYINHKKSLFVLTTVFKKVFKQGTSKEELLKTLFTLLYVTLGMSVTDRIQ